MATRAETAVVKLKDDAKEMAVLKKQVAKLQTKFDGDVLKARNAGLKYREIAEAADKSVAWVQATLIRAGHQTVGKTVKEPAA